MIDLRMANPNVVAVLFERKALRWLLDLLNGQVLPDGYIHEFSVRESSPGVGVLHDTLWTPEGWSEREEAA